MNIEELLKNATPLPFDWDCREITKNGEPIAIAAGDTGEDWETMRLLTHSANVLPKALEAMKDVQSTLLSLANLDRIARTAWVNSPRNAKALAKDLEEAIAAIQTVPDK